MNVTKGTGIDPVIISMGEGPHRFAWMYKTGVWQGIRSSVLAARPLCEQCGKNGTVRLATVVHHLTPHRGLWHLFVDPNNLQPVCKSCHDGEIQFMERRGYSNAIGEDGWPLDDHHPVNK